MWDWNHGVDGGKPQEKTSHNEEAGAFQVSADSMGKGQSLKDYAQATLGATDDAGIHRGPGVRRAGTLCAATGSHRMRGSGR